MHPLKPHEIQAGYSLDRRKLIEDFLHFAQSMNSIDDFNIARKTFGRQAFSSDSFEEVYWNVAETLSFPVSFIPNSIRFSGGGGLLSGLSSGLHKIDWSCNLLWNDRFGVAEDPWGVIAVPYCDGELLWDGADILIKKHHWDSTALAPHRRPVSAYYHSLNGSSIVTISSGKSEIGLLFIGFDGEWTRSFFDVSNLQMVSRMRVR